MAKTSPGYCIEYLPAILVVISVIYAGVLGRIDVLVLAGGMGSICYGLKIPIYNSLFLIAVATFLAAYLPFGTGNIMEVDESRLYRNHRGIIHREGFANEDDKEEFEGEEDFENSEKKENFEGEEEFEEEDKAEDFEGEEEFESEDKKEEFEGEEEFESENKEEEFEDEGNTEDFEGEEEFEDEGKNEDFEGEEEGFANPESKKKVRRVPPPDNGSRAEPLVLGKKYDIPNEKDDEDYHLDAGTTFLNAYKSLNPDQISAMTKDTQELINTQKQLMTTLTTLKPLISDGKQMMDTFQNYFGGNGGGLEGLGDLGKMAEKFVSK